ncbi:MAG: glycosyltransferase [Candidatus Peribacteraceae bacterium]|nr:glycosyltransferase [Candidatus Peribacteraceae bacterium]MDD5074894.1 glycosyltransferase [Candidatus Peribacteraceae bacterium]
MEKNVLAGRTIVFFGTADPASPRNRQTIERIKKEGADVLYCVAPLLRFRADGSRVFRGMPAMIAFSLKALVTELSLLVTFLFRFRKTRDILIGTLGHPDVLFFWPIKKLTGIRLLFDPLVSLYDTVILDRKLLKPHSFLARILHGIDRLAFSIADEILIDTRAHRDFLAQEFGVDPEKFTVIPLYASSIFRPMNAVKDPAHFAVLFHGKFIPLHGIEKVLRAMAIIEHSGEGRIMLRIAGGGQTEPAMRRLAQELKLMNIEWLGWVPYGELPTLINTADLCLGAFGDSDKARRVIPHKVWEALACGKRVISQKLTKPEADPLLVDVHWTDPSPEAIAEAILSESKRTNQQ